MDDEILIEACVDSVASAVAAERGGAKRVELCSGLIEGGVTPSAGLIAHVRAKTSIALYVMIRPRGGDFYYDADEFEIMRRDIATAKQLGADGVALGLLNLDGSIDVARTRELVELVRPLRVTFHRAFDMSADFPRALEDICATGADRILTSGGEQKAPEGVATIAKLVKAANGRIAIMAGSDINPENARELVGQTGAKEIHVGLRSSLPSPMIYQRSGISMGTVQEREYQRFVVLEESVRRLYRALTDN